jgi:hypothetical protein
MLRAHGNAVAPRLNVIVTVPDPPNRRSQPEPFTQRRGEAGRELGGTAIDEVRLGLLRAQLESRSSIGTS